MKRLSAWLSLASLAVAAAATAPLFTDEAARAGLSARVVSGDPDEKRFLVESVGGGLAVLDFDDDGWMDLYVPNGSTIEDVRAGRSRHPGALYRNNGDGTFSEATGTAGIVAAGWGKGALAADLNNDGYQDLYILNFGSNALYLNSGDGTFREVAAEAGVADPRWSSAAAAADYDGDGDLDLFVANYLDYDLDNPPTEGKFCSYQNLPVACGPRGLPAARDTLYRNNGDGTFTDVSVKSGVAAGEAYYGLGAAWGDYDDDGLPDLFVANDNTPNRLFRNNGDGTFVDRAIESGTAFDEAGREQACMGVEFEDLDNDGRLDLMVTNFSHEPNTFYRNLGDGVFRDDSHRVGLAADSWRDLSWGVGFFDFDNDGRKDVFVANGHIYPQMDRAPLSIAYRQPNKLYLNRGDGPWKAVAAEPGSALARPASHRGAAFADFNNDGRIDVAVVALDDSPRLLINRAPVRPGWVLIRLQGSASNRFGVGARVTVKTGDSVQTREVKAGGSYASSNDPRVHFGLGDAETIDELTVRWPSGRETRLRNVEAGRVLTIEE